MKHEEILEGNKLIAEFMGWKEHPKHKNCSINKNRNRVLPYWVQYNMEIPNDEFKYHLSWDWLMPVYQKINKYIQLKSQTDFQFNKDTDKLHFDIWNALEDENCCINFLYPEIIKFIKWYNEKNTNN